jgi:hypothetical protein
MVPMVKVIKLDIHASDQDVLTARSQPCRETTRRLRRKRWTD